MTEPPVPLDELKVVDTFDVKSPLSRPNKPVYFKNAMGLILADGTQRYACGLCPPAKVLTYSSTGKLRGHQQYDHINGRKQATAAVPKATPHEPPAKTTTRKAAKKATPPVKKTPQEKLEATAAYGKTKPPVETVQTNIGPVELVTINDAASLAVSAYPTDVEDLQVDQFLAQINGIAKSRDLWRTRALAAEEQLVTLKERNRRLATMKAILNQMRRELDALESMEDGD